MIFKVSQISPSVELIFANSDEYINVYPSYHQKGNLNYVNVDNTAWYVYGTQYRWETSFADINSETIPVIQLIYSYNATQAEKQNQYAAFKAITAVETVSGKLYLYANARPYTSFRIRYRVLNKLDLAIPLNRYFGVGIGYSVDGSQLFAQMTGFNPVTNQSILLSSSMPDATYSAPGAMPGGVLARLKKLEDIYDNTLTKPYSITGFSSASATSEQTTYYPDIASVQAVSQDTWYQECEMKTQTDVADFTTAAHLFYQQQATKLNVTHIYTGKVTTFSYALAANSLLQEITGLELLDTRSATDISYMFADDIALKRVDLSSLNLQAVTNLEGLFKNCTSLEYIDVSNIDFTYRPGSRISLIEQDDIFTGVPDDCVIYVGGEMQYTVIHAKYPNLTGITYN